MKAQQTGSSVEKEVYTAEAPEVQINGSFLPGDVDMSGEVDITDVVALVNYILSNDSSSSVLSNGDMDGNGSIDITDVVALVNLILSN
jgi:Ca2+-binding EF-hand superfamily protein